MIDKDKIIRREANMICGVKIKGLRGEWVQIKSWRWSIVLCNKTIEINLN